MPFTREADREYEDSAYNDSAFYYVALSFLALVLIPFTFLYLKRLLFGSRSKLVNCPCSICKGKDTATKSKAPSTGTIFKGVLLLGLWALFFVVLANIVASPSVDTGKQELFDPYAILSLEIGATNDEIKKAYRKMSLIHHPDKSANPNDPEVQERYIKIVKANEALTDELAKANWEKYGNPDGPQGFSVGIALPSWLVRKDNSMVVLSIYIAVLVVVLPLLVCWWRQWSKKDANKVQQNTMALYYHKLEPVARVKMIAELVGASDEYTHLPARTSDQPVLAKAIREIPERHHMKKTPKYNAPFAIKSNQLLYVQMSRLQYLLSPGLLVDLHSVLKQVRNLVGGVITIASARHLAVPLVESLKMLQMLTQSTWDDVPLLQLPHFTPEIARKAASGKKVRFTDIASFFKVTEEQRRVFFEEEKLTDNQIKDVETVLARIPLNVDFDFYCEMEGEEDSGRILTEGIVTVYWSIERHPNGAPRQPKETLLKERALTKNPAVKKQPKKPEVDKRKEDGEESATSDEEESDGEDKFDYEFGKRMRQQEDDAQKPLLHAPFLPDTREECWWIVISDPKDNSLVSFWKAGGFQETIEGKLKFMAPAKPGAYSYTVDLICDGYIGCDKQKPLRLVVQEDKQKLLLEKNKKLNQGKLIEEDTGSGDDEESD